MPTSFTSGSNYTLILPDSSGSAGQFLTTDGTNPANLYWSTVSSASFTGQLYGDVIGTQTATQVAYVCGIPACGLAETYSTVLSATSCGIPLRVVLRDSTGSFAATTITLTGNNLINYSSLGICDTGSGFVFAPTNQNTLIGLEAGNNNTLTGTSNVALGYNALMNVTGGFDNIALGAYALQNIQGGTPDGIFSSGSDNIAIGTNALNSSQEDTLNIAIGSQAMQNSNGAGLASANIALGYQALQNSNGNFNIGVGFLALPDVSGSQNVGIGNETFYGTLTTGSYNTAIGSLATVNSSNAQNQTALGYAAEAIADNTIMLGNNDIVSVMPGGTKTTDLGYLDPLDINNQIWATLHTVTARFYDTDNNYASFSAPAYLSNSYDMLLPLYQGAAGQVLTTDGNLPNAQLSWSTINSTSFTGQLYGDVIGTQTATQVAYVCGIPACALAQTYSTVLAGTSFDIPQTLVLRDDTGSFAATNVTATGCFIVKDSNSNNAGKICGSTSALIVAPQTTRALQASSGGSTRGTNAVDLQINTSGSYVAAGDYSVIAGGQQNTVGGNYSITAGGSGNTAGMSSDIYAIVVGGYQNTAGTADYPLIVGGNQNNASGEFSSILNGFSNQASTNYALIVSGANNIASGSQFSSVINGNYNQATADYATVINGGYNTAEGSYSFIGNGQYNTASGNHSALVGGYNNIITGSGAFIGGGTDNRADGDYSVALGQSAIATGTGSFVFADSTSTGYSSNGDNTFNVYATGGIFMDGIYGVTPLDADSLVIINSNGQLGSSTSYLSTLTTATSADIPDTLVLRDDTGSFKAYTITADNCLQVNDSTSAVAGRICGSTNGLIVAPQGTRALQASSGGGPRGTNAVDLQMNPTLVDVASGNFSVIAGGFHNRASGTYAVVTGGNANSALNTSATVGGGELNNAIGQYATIPGGYDNEATGNYSVALGQHAQASNQGSFVFADSTSTGYSSNGDNTFNVYATGGIFMDGIYGVTPLNADSLVIINSNGQLGSSSSYLSTLTTATSADIPDTLVLRDDTGSFEAYTITADNCLQVNDSTLTLAGQICGSTSALIVAPQGTRALQTNASGNTRGANAVDLQMSIASASQVAAADYSVITGGQNNQIDPTSYYAIVTGGQNNTIGYSSYYSVIASGQGNNLSGLGAVVGGGTGNTVANNYAFLGAGNLNTSSGGSSFVGAGDYNTNNASVGFIGAGSSNNLSGYYSSIVGGVSNNVNGQYAIVGGGQNNISNVDYSVSGGGQNNYINSGAHYGVIVGGLNNTLNGQFSFIGSGTNNSSSGNYAVIPGGANNIANGNYSVAMGQQAQALNQGSFVFADSQNSAFASTSNDSFNIRAQNGLVFQGNSTGNITFKMPTSFASGSDYTLILPTSSGTAGQFLTTGGGTPATLSWATINTASFTGQLYGDVIGTQTATKVAYVCGIPACALAQTYSTVVSGTSFDVPLTLVLRDNTGSFAATNVTATGCFIVQDSTSAEAGQICGNTSALIVAPQGTRALQASSGGSTRGTNAVDLQINSAALLQQLEITQ